VKQKREIERENKRKRAIFANEGAILNSKLLDTQHIVVYNENRIQYVVEIPVAMHDFRDFVEK